jgi:hypothetical protein
MNKLGKPDMSERCTCVTEAICHLHKDRERSFDQAMWNEQAFTYIERLEGLIRHRLTAISQEVDLGMSMISSAIDELEGKDHEP